MPHESKTEIDVIDPGYLDLSKAKTIGDLLNTAGFALDRSNTGDILGNVLVRTYDGKFLLGSLELTLEPPDPKWLLQTLTESYAQCQDCLHIEPVDSLASIKDVELRVAPGEIMPDGQCTECGAVSHAITLAAAKAMIAKAYPKKRKKREKYKDSGK